MIFSSQMKNRNFFTKKQSMVNAFAIILILGISCQASAREIYGVDSHIKRMKDIYTACEFLDFAARANLQGVDLTEVETVCSNNIDTAFNIVAVSGTLEEGFPLRKNLDFEPGTANQILSTFLGKALIRGLRAYLDIKGPGFREFKTFDKAGCLAGLNDDPSLDDVSKCQNINPGMVASGDWNDANIYSLYLIDRRQAVRALVNEPRFLSMTPDLAMVDIKAEETTSSIRSLILQGIDEDNALQSPKNVDFATVLTVVSTWNSCWFAPSPVLYTKSDGTRVTDFPNSLAMGGGTSDAKRASADLSDRTEYYAAIDDGIKQAIEAYSAKCN